MSNGIITLITDFGERDYYAGAMKAAILAVNPEAQSTTAEIAEALYSHMGSWRIVITIRRARVPRCMNGATVRAIVNRQSRIVNGSPLGGWTPDKGIRNPHSTIRNGLSPEPTP